MLKSANDQKRRSLLQERKLWQDEANQPLSIGCTVCKFREICGGIHLAAKRYSCLDHCCDDPTSCDTVCPTKARDFVERLREIGGFDLNDIPRSRPLPLIALPPHVPVLYHGASRYENYSGTAVSLPFFLVVSTRDGKVKVDSEEALRHRFKISSSTRIILSATKQDKFIESWWGVGAKQRSETIIKLRTIGVDLVTTPNYSMFTDKPRFDDMHSMKRIGLVWHEFVERGLRAALHINSRTEKDVNRWISFILDRPEVTDVSFEFGTGAGWSSRRMVATLRLIETALGAGRPLNLIVRGGLDSLPLLRQAFTNVSFLDTSSFMKTMGRRAAELTGNGKIYWRRTMTFEGQGVDDLLTHNISVMSGRIQ